ncbi:hypothetical protein DL771_003830 [Monosporascus sp. 5C6A]|nr:hypothetical protein DL771_003830 [Monosporascus sp. 5C6A]
MHADLSRLGNWVEFQNYHLLQNERLKEKADDLKKELNKIQNEGDGEHTADSAGDIRAIQQILKDTVKQHEQHEVLLNWIEQQRKEMETEQPNHGNQNIPKALQTATARRRAEKQQSAGLGMAGFLKAKPMSNATRKRKASGPEADIGDTGAAMQGISHTPKRRGIKPRRAQDETQNHQPRQAVPESRQSSTQSLGAGRIRSQRRSIAAINTVTRSGRISKPPIRWAPE